ncbi:hypothetical protein NDU88_005546 [Pleurodeles waltl]|uniref:Uncharacterized protein n=1 Tax=Pleurodeles waltl TaxID=8319 RepID=A0AAV7L554_PLEWA|nr:hypothetical protein NDU88_005546 [Pleurodeles waltl]
MQQKELKEILDIFGLQDIEPQEEFNEVLAAEEEALSISDSGSELETEPGVQTKQVLPTAQHAGSTKAYITKKHSALTGTKATRPPLPSGHSRH